MRDRILLIFSGLAAVIWIVPRLGFRVLADATLDPASSFGSQSALFFYQLGVWILLAVVVLVATALVASSLGLRGLRVAATSLVSTGLWALVTLGVTWLVSLAPLTLQVWALSELGTVATALLRGPLRLGWGCLWPSLCAEPEHATEQALQPDAFKVRAT